MDEPDYIRAHKHCIRHRAEILTSDLCGCFFCLAVFPPKAIKTWCDERDGTQTALCPECGIDSVIGSKAGFPITRDFLARMERHWFGMREQR